MASLFISYSRRDIEVARKLTESFKGQDLDFWIDLEGMPPTIACSFFLVDGKSFLHQECLFAEVIEWAERDQKLLVHEFRRSLRLF